MVDQSKLAAQTDAVFKSSRGYAEGGMPEDVDMQRVDPVSGNEIPPGSLAAEVRDDIPAQLSEGEYVVPADVVRYYGVKFFEDLRGEAKMGWQAMEHNGRIGGEPISPAGMEMGNDELPFDISELQFNEVDVPEENFLKAAEGMYVSGYGFGDFVKALFGGGGKSSSSSSSQASSNNDDYKDNKPTYQGGSGNAIGGGQKWSSGSKEPKKKDEPSLLEQWGITGSAEERGKKKKESGAYSGYKPKGYELGGWAKAPGDPGYEEEGALGLGAEGIGLQGGLRMVKYVNAAGDVIYIPFIGSVAQADIPEGYYPEGEVPEKAEETGTATTGVVDTGTTGAGDDDDYTKPMQSINFKELSNAELAQMLKQQQGLTGNAIAAGAGILNPILGLAVKFAMIDTSKRIKRELERRAADPNLTAEQKAEVTSMLEVAKKDQPKLLKRLFEKAKDVVEDVVDTVNPPEPLPVGPTSRQGPRGSRAGVTEEPTPTEPTPTDTTELDNQMIGLGQTRGMGQTGDDVIKLDEIVADQSEGDGRDYTVDENGTLLPTELTYDDLLMGEPSPVSKTISLDDIIGTAEDALSKIANIKDTVIEKGMEAGKDFDLKSLEETIAKLEEDPLFFMQSITPQAYVPTPTVPRVPMQKGEGTPGVKEPTRGLGSQQQSDVGATYTTSKSSGSNVGDSTDWSSVRSEAKKKSTQAITKATNDLASESEINDMKAAAARVDSYLADKESGKNTSGVYGFAEGGTVETQYTGLDAVKDMQKLNQYI